MEEYVSGQVDFELSTDGGLSWESAHGPVTFQLRIRYSGPTAPDTRHFDTEMLQMDLSGGTFPRGLGFRENPLQPSSGATTVRGVPGG